jgi:ribose transport system ATP-binding protein
MRGEKILELAGVTKDYTGTRALEDVSFDLYAGEVHCLVGENGAGKSTLIKILSGAVRPTAGRITLSGVTYARLEPSQSIALGIATIYQDVDLIPTLSVSDNIFLNDEIRSRVGFVDRKTQERRSGELLEKLSIRIDPRTLVEELSPAQKQMLQLAKALHREAKVIIMDEPTSSLGHEETRALMELVRQVTGSGAVGVIYISHFLEEVFSIGDRLTVLKDGRRIAVHEKGDFVPNHIIMEMVGREAGLFYQKDRAELGAPELEVQGFSRGTVVQDVTFAVHRGEIFGIGGLVGSGRTELANLLFGIDRRDSGKLLLRGKDITPRSPRAAITNGISMIMENRQEDSLFLLRPVKENIAVVRTERAGVFVAAQREKADVRDMIERFSIAATPAQEVRELSGGNQQKAVMSRWLLKDAELFIFDEPTKGVDIGAKQQIYKFMTGLAQKGKFIIMISSDMPELLSMSDRIGIMRGGRMIRTVPAKEVTEAELLKEFLGIDAA